MQTPNILSGKGPLFRDKLFITRPNLPDKNDLFPMLERMLESKWVTNFGAFHDQFAEKVRGAAGAKFALPCCNGAIGLFLLIEALELKGKVITTPFTFPATVHAVTMAGLEPILCDIDKDGYTLDMDDVERRLDSSVAAILGVNVFGNVCDLDRLAKLSEKRGITLIYDSAHAFLTRYKGKPVGGFGKAEMFSFHATKFFSTIEGGAVTTDDEALYRKLRDLVNFGIKNEERVTGIGLNAKMSEMNAIVGLLSYGKKDELLRKLSELSKLYSEKLGGIPGVKTQKVREGCTPNNSYMPVEIVEEEFGLSRDEVHEALKADNVITRKYFYPSAHQYECYKGRAFTRAALPNTEKVGSQILCLPNYASLRPEEAEKVCVLLAVLQKNAPDVRKALKKRS